MRFLKVCGGVCALAVFFLAVLGVSQAVTARLSGTITDASHATVPGTAVKVVNPATGQSFNASTDAQGFWTIPGVPPGTYTVTATHAGFKAQTVANVTVDAAVPATVNMSLAVGQTNETVEVTSGAEVVQTDSAAVSSTIEGQQIHDLPFTSRNATELIATQPGTQTGDAVRQSLVNGLPQSAVNITLDGVNIQDNDLKSTDGIFNTIMPRSDAVEEVTVSSAAGSADSLGEGAVQIKFVTRQGTNQWHGDLYEQNRNRAFESNYYFNSVNGLPRDQLNLNEFGGRIGGPILKNKLFVFFAMEAFRLPQTFLVQNQQWLEPAAQTGIFTYKDASGNVQTVNLYTLAANANATLPAGTRAFPTAEDPSVASTYAQVQKLTSAAGGLISRVGTNNDFNRGLFSSLAPAVNNRNFPTGRMDWNINSKNHFDFIANYQTNARTPDALNGTVAILPGTGTVLGSPDLASQLGDSFSYTGAWRIVLSPNITNEASMGFVGGTTWFDSGISRADFNQWHGVIPSFGFTTNPYRATFAGLSNRNSPVKNFLDTMTWVRGNHVMTFGGSFTQVNLFQSAQGSQTMPTITFGQATGDPDNTGATSMFTSTTLPGSSTQQRADAANLYAALTGRVSAVTSSASLGEATGTYGPNLTITRDQQREFSFFGQDAWRVTPNFTFNYGLRWEKQLPFTAKTGFYTAPGLAGLFGVSGIGNLFKPGTLTGAVPVFNAVNPSQGAYKSYNLGFDPTIGFAYQLGSRSGLLGQILGNNAVVRGGYAISSIREGMNAYAGVVGRNPGTNLSTSADPVNTPSVFTAGSVQFSDPSYPSQVPTSLDANYPKPINPFPVTSTNSLNDFDPNLKMEYVQSWNFGLERALGANTVVEVRYTGNHGTDLWRTLNLNEVNIFENQFLNEFKNAQSNLAIARQSTPTSNKFGNQGLAGQVDVPIYAAAFGASEAALNDQTTANQLVDNAAGAAANAIATNSKRMANLVAAGKPANFFVVNPTTNSSSNLVTNGGDSTYNALQIEMRHRLTHGLQLQGSYAYAKSLTNTGNNDFTLRDLDMDKGPSGSDIRHGFKVNWIYDLPFGQKHLWGGWQFTGVGRLQSGTPEEIASGGNFETFNQNDAGAVLHNISQSGLQSMMHITKMGDGSVFYLPQTFVNNSLAAFQLAPGGVTFDPTQPYIGPPTTPGALGDRIYIWGPWLSKWDVGLAKITPIHETMTLELRAQALNVFNTINFLLPTQGSTTMSGTFGQTTNAFRDFSNTNDPGARTVEFVIKLNF